MALSFSLSGLVRLSASLTNGLTVGSVADTATVLKTIDYPNGTTAGKANAYVRFTDTLAEGGDENTYTLASLSAPTATGTTYTAAIDKLRLVYVENHHATQRLIVSLLDGSAQSLSAIEVRGGGCALWSAGTSTVEESTIVTVTVSAQDSSTAATYDLVLVGVNA